MLKPSGYLALIGGGILIIGLFWFASYRLNYQAELPAAVGSVPAFELLGQDDLIFSEDDLRGKVTVVDFIFTRCPTICPMLNAQMLKLQKLFKSHSHFQLLSISIDPDHDSPEVLQAFGQKHGADPRTWKFLTGELESIRSLLIQGFKVAMPDEPLMHTDRFVLVDQELNIRGYYSLAHQEDMIRLQNDAYNLLTAKVHQFDVSQRAGR